MAGEFDRWWARYPRKVGKKAAQQRWDKLSPDDAMVETIMSALEAQLQTAQWQKAMLDPEMTYIPHGRTWLSQERFNDSVVCGPVARTKPSIDPAVQALCDRYMVPQHDVTLWLTGAFLDDAGRLVVSDETNYGWCAKHYGPLFGVEVTRR